MALSWLCFAAGVVLAPQQARADPNRFEQHRIEAAAQEAFKAVLGLWREEVYFEMYETGMSTSKTRISQEDFARRMVELEWVPLEAPNPKFMSTEFHFRTVVYVSARLKFRNKFNPDLIYEKLQRMLLLKEEGQWRVDLVQLVRAPFS